MTRKLPKHTPEEGRLLVMAEVLGIVDNEMKQFAPLISPRYRASASQWASDLETVAHLHKLTTEGRAALIELASPRRSLQRG